MSTCCIIQSTYNFTLGSLGGKRESGAEQHLLPDVNKFQKIIPPGVLLLQRPRATTPVQNKIYLFTNSHFFSTIKNSYCWFTYNTQNIRASDRSDKTATAYMLHVCYQPTYGYQNVKPFNCHFFLVVSESSIFDLWLNVTLSRYLCIILFIFILVW